MNEIKNDLNESYSSNLLFLRENHDQEDWVNICPQKLTLNFENVLFLSAHCKMLVTVLKKWICRVDQWSKLVFQLNAENPNPILKGIFDPYGYGWAS